MPAWSLKTAWLVGVYMRIKSYITDIRCMHAYPKIDDTAIETCIKEYTVKLTFRLLNFGVRTSSILQAKGQRAINA
jgi:hypothetical protein